MCACVCIDERAIIAGRKRSLSKGKKNKERPRRSASAKMLRAFNDTRVRARTRLAGQTETGPRESPVLVSDDQCVRPSSLNVRETLVAIKIRLRYVRDRLRFLASILFGIVAFASTLAHEFAETLLD